DQERLGTGADQVDTSWNGVANGLGFVGIVGFGLGFQSKSARTVFVREGASVVRSTSDLEILLFVIKSLFTEKFSSSLSVSKRRKVGNRWRYDVFLNFRGKELRSNFISHLYKSLVSCGISTFKDDQEEKTFSNA
ncbi:hypothetical protein F2Q69_00021644, partial [Brassica cretica]